MKPTESAAPVSRLRGFAGLTPPVGAVVVAIAALLLAVGSYRTVQRGDALFPDGAVGWSFAVLTGIIVGHLVALGRDRWWGGTGSGAALTLAVLLLYGWLPAVLVSLAVVVLVGTARRHRWWQGLLHGGVDMLGIAAAALVLAAFGEVPTVEEPWRPLDWGVAAVPELLLTASTYLLVTRVLLWYAQAPHNGGLPTIARTAMLRQGLVAVALLGLAPLICAVAMSMPVLLPLFAVPLIALDSTLWIARARAEEQLRDPLTGLPNRQWLLERTWSALEDAESIGTRSALVLIDLDRFRAVNDTLGHLAGDRLLLQIAERLRLALPRGAEAARLGGDEFAVLLPHTDSTTSAQQVARHLVAELSSPLDLDGLTLVLEASAGVAVYPDHSLDAEGLLRRADVAMYQAKRDRTGVEVYESKRDSNTPDRLGLLGDLRRALDAGEVELHYQPKVRFDGQVAGLEALVRWVHPERGRVPPDEFIAIAESSGLMPHLTEYVLETALAQVARWRAQGLCVPVAVNVSPRDVHTPGFAGGVAARLARHGVPAGALQLEITEHVLLEDPQRAADTLAGLTAHGVKMSLDDFGTGYSSLVHLRRLPVSELKIDRSFVARLAVDHEDAEIVRCTIDLAHSLGLVVVAEGVEDDETWERLRNLRCDAVQGWLVAAAMPPLETTAWLRARGEHGWRRPAELKAQAAAATGSTTGSLNASLNGAVNGAVNGSANRAANGQAETDTP
ncbi:MULTISPECIES: putative bifunctional diguanylate cyclase/phosphodiesterase [Streptomyces]|uniref:putative bifunctional diguanylate cyclase/phosphodiesterase n=1 Tax=Streptomyces TaxID=1883 RepID=UPI0015C466E6|nr:MULTISPECIES: bifunctional diguanylate cyclase/phosphodiesterase [Streptomyces]MBD3548782.1 bifunctional diguanylate cyclase/phosphodiesterase [Streptomyces sp. JV180]MBK0374232.1 bifunctional diguanylate cyclase/phosphodiesterase [Streptomyces sp. RB110-1]MBK0389398.1 bifunctional diguanylate cyclase/phosphodiesterase [Streptomyces sp. RB110-2]MCF3166274.1 bifunctional diguanylate cyclase/phosphodiesterase [Streptomyces violaceoruber]QLG31858.1 bifunctional diguanylate cyclase/phosphodiest